MYEDDCGDHISAVQSRLGFPILRKGRFRILKLRPTTHARIYHLSCNIDAGITFYMLATLPCSKIGAVIGTVVDCCRLSCPLFVPLASKLLCVSSIWVPKSRILNRASFMPGYCAMHFDICHRFLRAWKDHLAVRHRVILFPWAPSALRHWKAYFPFLYTPSETKHLRVSAYNLVRTMWNYNTTGL